MELEFASPRSPLMEGSELPHCLFENCLCFATHVPLMFHDSHCLLDLYYLLEPIKIVLRNYLLHGN